MVRGCQRRVIFVKNTGSEMFDEALFFVGADTKGERTEEDMIREADRIISEQICEYKDKDGVFVRGLHLFLRYGVALLIGGLIGALIVALL